MTAIDGLLKSIPLLSLLTPPQLVAVAGVCERCAFAPGESIVLAGTRADAAYYLMDGNVDCVTWGPDGEQIATPIPSGAVLLEMAMIVDLDISANCVARAAAKVLKLPRAAMHDVMQNDPALTDKMIEALTVRLRDMADAMREASQPFEELQRSA